MAEPTEQEQLKTNQHLSKIDDGVTEVTMQMSSLIDAVKQPATYETDLLREIKDQGEDQAQTDKKTLKSQKAFHEDVKELTKNSSKEKDHNKFMETIEKKKLGIQEATFKDKKREDKFKTREDSKFLKWTERKWDGLKKSTDSWLSGLGKLLALIAAFGILTWLKGKNLRKQWEDFLKVIDDWEKILPEWVKNLTIPEAIKTGIAAVGAAWLTWSAGLKLAASSLRALGTGLERWFGIDAPFTKRLAELDLNVAKLTKKQAALQRAIKFASNLDDVSDLSAKLKLTNEALDLAKAEVSAVSRAKDLANALSDEAALAKKLRDANLQLLKAEDAKAVAQRAFDLGSDLAPDCPLAIKLSAASDDLARATKQASVADEALRLANVTTRAAQRTADAAAGTARARGAPPGGLIRGTPIGTPYQKLMNPKVPSCMRWWVEIDGTQVMISKEVAKKYGANIGTVGSGVCGLKNLKVAGGFGSPQGMMAEIKQLFGMSPELGFWRQMPKVGSDLLKFSGDQLMKIPGAQTFMKFLRNPATQRALTALNVLDAAKGSQAMEKEGGARVAGAEASIADAWSVQMVKLGEIFSGYFFRDGKYDFSWSEAMAEDLADDYGIQINRWGEQMKDEHGRLLWETDALGNPKLDEKGKPIPKFADMWNDYRILQKTSFDPKKSFDPKYSKTGHPFLNPTNSKAWMMYWMQDIKGLRFRTDPTGKTTIHQTDTGVQQSIERLPETIKESLEDIINFVTPKASDRPAQSNTFIQSSPTSFRGGSRGVIDPNHGLLYS